MTPNFAHKIVHSSAMYYQNLIIIHESSKKLFFDSLGVELSKNLTWAKHINQTAMKSNKMLGLLRSNLGNCTQSTKDIAYKTLVRPRLEYCSAIWDPHQKVHIDNLEKVQRRAARFVTNNYKRTSSVTKIIEDLKWDTLQKRRTMARLTVLYKETHSKIPSNIHHLLVDNGCKPQTRQHHSLNYNTIQSNKDCYRYSLYPRNYTNLELAFAKC